MRSGGPSDKLGADEGGHQTPAGGLLWGVKSRGLAIKVNSYLTAERRSKCGINTSHGNDLCMKIWMGGGGRGSRVGFLILLQ